MYRVSLCRVQDSSAVFLFLSCFCRLAAALAVSVNSFIMRRCRPSSLLLLLLQHVASLSSFYASHFPSVCVCVCPCLSVYVSLCVSVCVCMFSFYLCYNFPYAFSILCAASLFLPVAVCYNFPLFCSILIWFHKVLLFVFQAFILAFLYSLFIVAA